MVANGSKSIFLDFGKPDYIELYTFFDATPIQTLACTPWM